MNQAATVLTARQSAILAFVTEEIRTKSLPPTRAEIAKHFGFRSSNAAEEHLKALAKRGMIVLIPGTSRGIRLPILGEVVPCSS